MTRGVRTAGLAMAAIGLAGSLAAAAQTRSANDAITAYGARLDARGQPASLNRNRVNNRINSRLDTRLSLRIERYRPDADPTAAFAAPVTDNSQLGTLPAAPPSSDDAAAAPPR